MKFNMMVMIKDPNTEEGKSSTMVMKLTALFDTKNDKTMLLIRDENCNFENLMDITHDKNYDAGNEEGYLAIWADNYWSGKNGAYEVESLKIERL